MQRACWRQEASQVRDGNTPGSAIYTGIGWFLAAALSKQKPHARRQAITYPTSSDNNQKMKSKKSFLTIISIGLISAIYDNSSLSAKAKEWKPQEIAVISMTRCLVTGGHFSRNEAAKFIAQINKEQSGQFQRVYDSIFKGVSNKVNKQVTNAIKSGGGCRLMLTEFAYSEPDTPFKRDLVMDWLLEPISYPDD